MRLGVWLPIVSAHPASGVRRWHEAGTAEDLSRIVVAAEQAGYDCACAPEHVALPVGRPQGTTYWDPVSTLGFLAARTHRIRLAVLVSVLGYHHPLELAKRYGTLQRLAGPRVVLGVAAGGTRAEFDLLDAPFTDRGPRADESVRAIRAATGTTEPAFSGSFRSFSDVVVDPSLHADTPIWVGGGSRAALRRALGLGDGWAPTGLTFDELESRWTTHGRAVRPGFELVFLTHPADVIDPLGDRSGAQAQLDLAWSVGVTTLLPRVDSRSADHHIEQLHALAGLLDGRS